FDYSLDYAHLDLRAHPELYRIGRGEQGVLKVEPYKSEILPHWRFATPQQARASSEKITDLFQGYLADDDFVGADMARKFLQMGFTRARRYANYPGGRKYRGAVPRTRRGRAVRTDARRTSEHWTRRRPRARASSSRHGTAPRRTRAIASSANGTSAATNPTDAHVST